MPPWISYFTSIIPQSERHKFCPFYVPVSVVSHHADLENDVLVIKLILHDEVFCGPHYPFPLSPATDSTESG